MMTPKSCSHLWFVCHDCEMSLVLFSWVHGLYKNGSTIFNPRRVCSARVTVLGLCVCVSVTQHLTLYVQSISVVFECFRSVSDLRLRFRNHIHIVCDRACGAGSNHGGTGERTITVPACLPRVLVLPLLLTLG